VPLAAVLVGFAIYLILPILLAFNATPAAFREDPLIWISIAAVPISRSCSRA